MIWSHVFADLTAYAFPKALPQLLWPPGYSPTPGTLLIWVFAPAISFAGTLLTQISTRLTPSSPFFIQMWGLSQSSYCSLPPPHSLSQFPCFVFPITYSLMHTLFCLIFLFISIYKIQNSVRVQIFVCSDFFIDVSTVTWKLPST